MFEVLNFAVPILLVALIASGLAAAMHKNKKLSFVSNTIILILILAFGIYYSIFSISFTAASLYNVYPFSSFLLVLFPLALIIVNTAALYLDEKYVKFGTMLPILSVGILSVGMAASLLTIIVSIERSCSE